MSAHLQAGFLSSGTFSSSFEKQTGMTPKQYQKQLAYLYQVLTEYEANRPIARSHYEFAEDGRPKSRCVVNLRFPEEYRPGITFVGLFRQPIPNHRPIVGKAVVGSPLCVLDRIPEGKLYLLSCSVEKGASPASYFVLKDCLRARIEEPLHFPKNNMDAFALKFRPPLPHDPPITINLPKILADVVSGEIRRG